MIEFTDVYKAFGSNKVLNGLTVSIPKGKITFILGKSGEGKSVTIKHIMGLLAPDSGSITVEGEDIRKFDEYELRFYRRKFGNAFSTRRII